MNMSPGALFGLLAPTNGGWPFFFIAGLIPDANDILIAGVFIFLSSSLGLVTTSFLLTVVIPRLTGRKSPAISQFIRVEPLLLTKLHPPHIQGNLVQRPHLADGLATHRLILVSAPAGSGKTVLLRQWMQQGLLPCAYVRLDSSDDSAHRLLAYIVAALQTIRPGLGRVALTLLNSPGAPAIESILTLLINDLSGAPGELGLILDDYHHISTQSAHDVVAFLIEHAPPSMHIVIACRTTPPLPLPRWRASGDMLELRAEDLHFSPAETTFFLNEVMGLNLSSAQGSALYDRTEGWIAGLRLMAQPGTSDADWVAGCPTFVARYLVEEVFAAQPALVQRFLLQTVILDRLCASLCNALTGQEDGEAMLETLIQTNLFLIPAGDWYRYHHLFADFLRDIMRRSRAAEIPALHRCAAGWYEQHGMIGEAIKHALAAADFGWAARLSGKDSAPPHPELAADMPRTCPPREIPETLSEREVEVLQLITLGLSNLEIAERLTVTLNTVKTHIRSIYGKLDARSRVQAILRAKELDLLQ
jgi:ATP/maltotriose-dependent transcriptional regulator MalT